MINTTWPGTSALIKWILPAIFVVSLVTWALGIAFIVRLANHDLAAYRREDARVSDAELYFYSSALPTATTLAAFIDYTLYTRHLLSPIASIVWGILAFGLWLFMIVEWVVCEYSPDTGGEGCPNFYVYDTYPFDGVYRGETWTPRVVFACVACVLALTQMALGARAVDSRARERRLARKEKVEGNLA